MPPPDHDPASATQFEGPQLCPICNVYDCETPRPGVHDWMTQRALRHLAAEFPGDFGLEAVEKTDTGLAAS